MTAEEYLAYHKHVFRVAFDFLNSHFPPGDDLDWWKQYAEEIAQASCKATGGTLANGMLAAISEYLEEIYKQRRDENGQTEH